MSRYTHCRGCGKRMRVNILKYCTKCIKLARRLHSEHFHPKARKYFWAYVRKYGLRCCISNVSLEIDDDTSPWYPVFSRLIPGDKTKIAPAAALMNEMKSRLSGNELHYYVLALDDHRQKHLKVRKRPLVHWQGLKLSPGEKECAGCRRAAALKGRKYCARCARLAFRMKHARLLREAMDAIWDYLRKYGYVCYYTGMALDTEDPKSPWYLVFDHWMPRDPRKIVITSALVNEMKSDMTEDEFWYIIRQLANHFRKGSVVRKRKLAYWSRPYR
jgi:hypothetical protein